MKKNSHLVVNY